MSPAGALTAADHTAVVRFCLARGLILSQGAHNQRSILSRAAESAEGRVREVLLAVGDGPIGNATSVEGLRIGLSTAQVLLDHGSRTIYRPGYWQEEGMLRTGAAADPAIAELALTVTTAAVRAGAASERDPEQAAIRAAIVASAPVAVRLAAALH